MDIIDYYHTYQGKKTMLYYEDLILQPSLWVTSIYSFYQMQDKKKLEYFINNIDDIMQYSKEMNYKENIEKVYLGCYKVKSNNKINFYQERICKRSKQKSQDMIITKYNYLLKYIEQYL